MQSIYGKNLALEINSERIQIKKSWKAIHLLLNLNRKISVAYVLRHSEKNLCKKVTFFLKKNMTYTASNVTNFIVFR